MTIRDYTFDILDYKEPVTKIYFVRHGQTKANKNGLIFGQWDLPLNQTGIKQAKKTAEKLAKIARKEKIDAILCSPLTRTKQTASIIAKKLVGANGRSPKITINRNLIENLKAFGRNTHTGI